MAHAPVTVFAPAKINLALHVIGRRADGYHLMDMLVAFAATGDSVRVEPAARDSFAVSGRYSAFVPLDGANLVLRARDALRAAFGAERCPPVAIALEKTLPPASGMGGGSADAAATLKALVRLWALPSVRESLAALALTLGADVPMCLEGGTLRASGVGEVLDPIDGMPCVPAVLVNPGVDVATPAVFKALAAKHNPPPPDFPGAADAAGLARWLADTRNDLQAPAIGLAPAIGDTLEALKETAPLFTRMTGSGATCFGLYPSDDAAKQAAAAISAGHPDWYVAATRLG